MFPTNDDSLHWLSSLVLVSGQQCQTCAQSKVIKLGLKSWRTWSTFWPFWPLWALLHTPSLLNSSKSLNASDVLPNDAQLVHKLVGSIHGKGRPGFTVKTLPKAQRTRGLSSYHKFKHKSWSYFIFRISTRINLKISTKHQLLHKT